MCPPPPWEVKKPRKSGNTKKALFDELAATGTGTVATVVIAGGGGTGGTDGAIATASGGMTSELPGALIVPGTAEGSIAPKLLPALRS